MKGWVAVVVAVTIGVAGCTSPADPDGVTGQSRFEADVASTHPKILEAHLSSNVLEGEAPLELNLSLRVDHRGDDFEWSLEMVKHNASTVFKMGEGGAKDLPAFRELDLDAGDYTVTFAVQTKEAISQATLDIAVSAPVVEVDPCQPADGYDTFMVAGVRYYSRADMSGEIWEESNDMEGLQTPESCPDGPHDTRVN